MSQQIRYISTLNVDGDARKELAHICNDRLAIFSTNQKRFVSFVTNLDIEKSVVDIALFMLLSKVCNYFKSALLQCENNLFPEACNSVRMALEHGWLAKIIHDDNVLAFEWMTFFQLEDSFTPNVKKYQKRFGSLDWIRRTSSSSAEELNQKEAIYKLLSIRSHSNVASSYFSVRTTDGAEYVGLYGPGGLSSIGHQAQCVSSICYCHDFLLSELQVAFDSEFGAKWQYDIGELVNLAEAMWLSADEKISVVPERVNLARQINFFIALNQSLPKEAFDQVRSRLPDEVADKVGE